ncbi:MAG: hypothetical protein OJF49_004063 [Ktedonobacterales bacterium]|nr:MAG: hypothetical protein OJF49_004063 [Ktedonobacterales bacterium]
MAGAQTDGMNAVGNRVMGGARVVKMGGKGSSRPEGRG